MAIDQLMHNTIPVSYHSKEYSASQFSEIPCDLIPLAFYVFIYKSILLVLKLNPTQFMVRCVLCCTFSGIKLIYRSEF